MGWGGVGWGVFFFREGADLFLFVVEKVGLLKDEIVLRDFSCVIFICCAVHLNADNVLQRPTEQCLTLFHNHDTT